ncbi:hypothetical protein AGR4C_pa50040 [Agrobacterium tumefaciens str. Kerr 14]|uniref:Uncharacterized protein n=1 Tax=Agrobacterium tumefaciens str. Kerr 14 TaxID=1183424 RepID=A0A1S7SAI6_AGRTU|nr:hypothetical protein [Agrobacterium tumefaciens]CUX65555.1 hypothetical protein AGR4C_pa50040 [Agrobacterium tumefaciens str. Kerr 14]
MINALEACPGEGISIARLTKTPRRVEAPWIAVPEHYLQFLVPTGIEPRALWNLACKKNAKVVVLETDNCGFLLNWRGYSPLTRVELIPTEYELFKFDVGTLAEFVSALCERRTEIDDIQSTVAASSPSAASECDREFSNGNIIDIGDDGTLSSAPCSPRSLPCHPQEPNDRAGSQEDDGDVEFEDDNIALPEHRIGRPRKTDLDEPFWEALNALVKIADEKRTRYQSFANNQAKKVRIVKDDLGRKLLKPKFPTMSAIRKAMQKKNQNLTFSYEVIRRYRYKHRELKTLWERSGDSSVA